MLSNTQRHAGRAKRFQTNSRALVVLPTRAGRRSGTHHRADESEGRGCQRCHGNHSGMLLQQGIVVWWPRSPKLPVAAGSQERAWWGGRAWKQEVRHD